MYEEFDMDLYVEVFFLIVQSVFLFVAERLWYFKTTFIALVYVF
jgi:hypothetical protein